MFSFRGSTSDMILCLDSNSKVSSSTLGFLDFKATLAYQVAVGATGKTGARTA